MTKPPRSARADGEATRARILEAAGALFASQGFAETTNKAVAAQAGVDLASINYHFGNRDGLYRAVLVEAHHRMVDFDDLQRLAHSALPSEGKLRQVIGQFVRQAQSSAGGWHLAVLASALLAPSSHAEVLFQSEIPKKMALVTGILADITGLAADDPALLRCLMSVAAPCLVLLISRSGIPGPMQQVRAMPPEALIEHLHRFALAGLAAISRDHAQLTQSPPVSGGTMRSGAGAE